LENLDAQDLIISSVANIKGVLADLEELIANSSYEIDTDEVTENIMETFASVGSKYHKIFRKKEKPTTKTLTNSVELEGEAEDNLNEDIKDGT
jgi:hypothetical protein